MKSKIASVITDLTKHIKNEQELDDIKTPRKYYYDRMEWVRINKSSRDDLYEIGLENLRVLVYQLGLFQRHILTDEEGNEINQIITE
tara:strand:+ start:1044 stop:1304 length:261 start_codon:yes stop_codon:yes gene_type:complete